MNNLVVWGERDGMFNFSQDTFTRQLVRPKLGQARIKRVVVSDLECSDGAVFSDFIDAITANTDELRVFQLVRVNSTLPNVRPQCLPLLATKCQNLKELYISGTKSASAQARTQLTSFIKIILQNNALQKLSLTNFSDKAEYGKLILQQLAAQHELLAGLQQLNLSDSPTWFSDRTHGGECLRLLV